MKIFISSCRALLALALVVAAGPRAAAQLVSGEVFIQGSYVETALAGNGAFGSVNTAPAGYHTRSGTASGSGRLGFVSDPNKDGWTVGTPAFFGDYFLPDNLVNSQEGWRVQIGSTVHTAWRGSVGSSFTTSGLTTSASISGSNTAYTSVGTTKTGTWQGTIGSLKIKQVTTLNTNQLFMVVNVTLSNTGSTTLSNVYYERVVNPDNEYMLIKTGASYFTNNKIEYKLPNTKNKTLVSGTGATYGAYMGLGTNDCRAKGFICDNLVPSLSPANAYAEASPYAYAVTVPPFTATDNAIGIVYQLGDIAAGDSTTLAFAYVLKAADLDTAFAQIQHSFINGTTNYQSSDTLRMCPGNTTLAINNPGGYSWEWSPATGLSATAGPTVTVAVDTIPITYRAIGTNLTSGCGSLGKDTIYLNIKPHAVPQNVHISPGGASFCSGDSVRLAGRFTAPAGSSVIWTTTATDSAIYAKVPGYYVFRVTTANGCRAMDTAIVTENTRPATPVVTDIEYCQGVTASALTATALSGAHLTWYTDSAGGTGSATAFIPTTTTVGTQTYYVSQTNDTTSCEGPRAKITVTIKALPAMPTVAADTIAYCLSATATALSATGAGLKWYMLASGGSGSTTAIVPATGTVGFTTYYVTQTNSTSLCESPRKPIVVRIKALPALPAVVSPVAYCAGATATALSATGTHLSWYADSTGGAASATAPTPATTTAGTTYFYVSQTNDTSTCESPRAKITVTINALPALPVAADTVVYCQNAAAVALSATGTNLKWYTSASGGSGTATAPTPVTTATGFTTYYVSQTNGTTTCEGPRKAIVVRIKSTPAAPGVTTPVTYCSGVTPSALTATGTSLKWYSLPGGGSSSTTAPTPATGTGGSTTFYVSQTDTSTGCESPRASIIVTVNTTPDSPLVTTPVIYCQNDAAVALTATGSSLKWYNAATGGTGSTTAPTPSTSSSGNTNYYVSQTSSLGCESKRTRILVTVNALPAKPAVTTPVTYCQNATPVALTATGTSLVWYTVSSGGTGAATAPTPSTATVGTTTYYVTQTSATTSCVSLRASIDVVINALPLAPVVTTPVNLCQGVPAPALTATGSSLLWYTGAAGGTGSSTAPVPPTLSLGSTSYYVSQTNSLGCEGPRTELVATVNAIPAAPAVVTPVDLCVGVTPAALNATGTNLKWYAALSGGTGSSTATIPAVGVTGTFSYYVSQTSSVGCESPRATINTTVHPSPVLTLSAPHAPDFVYCHGATVTLKADAPTAISYQWLKASVDIPGETYDTTLAGTNNYYGVRVTDVYGCQTTKTVFVFKDTLPKPNLAPTSVQMCNGVNIMLYCSPADLSYTYMWSKDGSPMGGPAPSAISMSETGIYEVAVTDYYGCTSTTNVSTISAYPAVTKPTITRYDMTLRLSAAYASQQWYRNKTAIPGATASAYTISFDGMYYAQVYDANGCTTMSDTIYATALGIPGVNGNQPQLKLYPNPTQGKVTIETSLDKIRISVQDVTGREVLRREDVKEIDLGDLADGMYLFTITDSNGLPVTKEKIHKLSTR